MPRRHSDCAQQCHGLVLHLSLLYIAHKLCIHTSVCSAMQKGFGQCSADFMTNTSPTNPNGLCAKTCGRCNCPAALSDRSPASQSSSPTNNPGAGPNSLGTATNSPRPSPSSPVAVPSSPGRSPSEAGTAQAPPQPLSAAFAASCDCSDVPPDGTTCASVVSFVPNVVAMPICDQFSMPKCDQFICVHKTWCTHEF